MFNEELKNDYFSTCHSDKMESYISIMKKIFEKADEYERKHDKDLSNFTVNEIIEYYKSLLSNSLESLVNYNSVYSNYTKYLLSQNLVNDNQNHYEEISEDILLNCMVKRYDNIITREELLRDISELKNPCDQFLVLALFEGICGRSYSDFYDLKAENFQNEKVILSDRVLKVSKELVKLARESAEEYVYIRFQTDENEAKSKIMNFDRTDDNIIKRKNNTRSNNPYIMRQRIYSQTIRIQNFFGKSVYTAKNLLESGRLEMIKGLLKDNPGKSIKDVILDNIDVIKERYGNFSSDSISRYLLKYGKYFEGD